MFGLLTTSCRSPPFVRAETILEPALSRKARPGRTALLPDPFPPDGENIVEA